jgi:hypothetical protein
MELAVLRVFPRGGVKGRIPHIYTMPSAFAA